MGDAHPPLDGRPPEEEAAAAARPDRGSGRRRPFAHSLGFGVWLTCLRFLIANILQTVCKKTSHLSCVCLHCRSSCFHSSDRQREALGVRRLSLRVRNETPLDGQDEGDSSPIDGEHLYTPKASRGSRRSAPSRNRCGRARASSPSPQTCPFLRRGNFIPMSDSRRLRVRAARLLRPLRAGAGRGSATTAAAPTPRSW